MSTIDEVNKRIENAVIGRRPIVFIKNASPTFIRSLLCSDSFPITLFGEVKTHNDSITSSTERLISKQKSAYLPFEELGIDLEKCKNLKMDNLPSADKKKDNLPSADNDYYYKAYIDPVPGDTKGEGCIPPAVWCKRISEADFVYKGESILSDNIISSLEKYVIAHENPRHSQYRLLQDCLVILYSDLDGIFEKLTPFLKIHTAFIDIKLPIENEIKEIFEAMTNVHPLPDETKDAYTTGMIPELKGLSEEEISVTLRAIVSEGKWGNVTESKTIVRDSKKQKMKSGALQLCSSEGILEGMDNYKEWLIEQRKYLDHADRIRSVTGVPSPKGVLLCGIPGCGKSAAAKFTAKQFKDLNFIKLDVGSLMNKWQGGSEEKMREALATAEAVAPAILWIDELEKAFSAAGSSGENDASFQRMFGYLLTWMQENESSCFIIATANDISMLPKEFFRSGRFDALFATFLPTRDEAIRIFLGHMDKAQEEYKKKKDDFLFDRECFDLCYRENHIGEADRNLDTNCYLGKIIDETMLKPDRKTPRLFVGSDITNAVHIAVRKIMTEEGQLKGPVNAETWGKKLRDVITDKRFRTFGDGEENVDAIAASYCMMLRKNFIPASCFTLFDPGDYHVGNYDDYLSLKNKIERLQALDTELECKPEDKESARSARIKKIEELKKELKKKNILQVDASKAESFSGYDKATYDFLGKRINDIAFMIEKREKEKTTENK